MVKEEWFLNWEYREHKDAFLGKVKSRSRWARAGSISDGFLRSDLPEDEEVIEAEVEGLGSYPWRAVQLWTFKEGRFIRRVVTTKLGGGEEERAESLLVYDFKRA